MSLLFLLLSIGLSAQPKLVAIKSLDADPISYEAWLSNNHDVVTYVTYLESITDLESASKKLNEDFFNAKSLALKGATKEAKEKFLSITEAAHNQNWKDLQQEIIYHSLLYLSEIADSQIEKKIWLTRAINFMPWYLPKFDSYSQSTQMLYKKTAVEIAAKQMIWRPYERFHRYNSVLVNGRKFDIGPDTTIKLGNDKYRLTFISNELLSQTNIVQSEFISALSILEEPMVAGSCGAPKATPPKYENLMYVVFFDKKCIKFFDGENWSDFQKNKLAAVLPNYNLHPDPFNSMNLDQEKKNRNKRWKWIGASVLAAAIGYAIYDHNRPTEVRQVVIDPED